MTALTVDIPTTLVDALADAVIARLNTPSEGSSTPWLNVEQAAAYIGDAPLSRVYDLVQRGTLQPHRDGRRLLFKRAALDAYIEASS